MWPKEHPADSAVFWLLAAFAFYFIYRTWKYVKIALLFTVFALILGTIFVRGNNTGPYVLPPASEETLDFLRTSDTWAFLANLSEQLGFDKLVHPPSPPPPPPLPESWFSRFRIQREE